MNTNNKLLNLPNEILLYLLENFLDLTDLWSLFQTSSELRIFSSTVIVNIWKIEIIRLEQDNTMKIQCRGALISLSEISKEYTEKDRMEFLTAGNEICSEKEKKLHFKIIQGISSYKHKYVLIEDIDIRNRIRTTVDVVFHHAVFVAAISHSKSHGGDGGALAAILVRLLSQLDIAFPSYCREITYTLADNIKAFLEYTGYKILASHNLNITFLSLSACFEFMGAAFVGKILSDSHIDCAVQRTLELLSNHHTRFKKSLLVNLLDHWIAVKREVGSGELCRYLRLEIEKCDRTLQL